MICIKAAQADAPLGSFGRAERRAAHVESAARDYSAYKRARDTLHHVQRIFPFADAADVSVKTER